MYNRRERHYSLHNRKGLSTMPCVNTGGGRGRPVPCLPVPLLVPRGAGRVGSLLQIGRSLHVRPVA